MGKQAVDSVSDKRHGDMNVMAIREGDWERVQVTVDSGAMRNVIPKKIAQAFKIQPSNMTRAGINFVAANDTVIKNYGCRHVVGMTDGWNIMNFRAHVADVMEPLASVVEMEESDMRVVFERGAGYIQSVRTGTRINLYREGRKYKFDIWVPANAEAPAEVQAPAVKSCVEKTKVNNKFSALVDDGNDEKAAVDSDAEYAVDF